MSYTDRFRTDTSVAPPQPRTSRASGSSSMTSGRLVSMIQRACAPSLLEPNLALNLDIAEAINSKKGTFPREAAVEIVKLVNSRTPQTPILALGLLDICVKNCGYPFHLQVSRKEFLNELVRKFPERPPPMQYSRVQMLILEQIQFWKETICKTSKYRQDLGYIRDMHRLLEYKGYIFPEINVDDASVLAPTEDVIRSAAEIEEEEREAQSAKLQELIRRGTRQDLQEANHLMGIMTGYKKEGQVDYQAKAAKDLDRLRRKADLLAEMLQTGQLSDHDDVYAEIADTLKTAQRKLTQLVNDDKHDKDEDEMMKLLTLNDYIHSLVTRYDLLKQGHKDQAEKIKITPPSESSGAATKPDTSTKQALIESLIDIDDEPPSQSSSSQQPQASGPAATENLIDALDGLSFGNIALGSQTHSPKPQESSSGSPAPVSANSTGMAAPLSSNSTGLSAPLSANSANSIEPSAPKTATTTAASSAGQVDDWEFFTAPSTQQQDLPSKTLPVSDSTLKIDFEVQKDASRVTIRALFVNKSPLQLVSNLQFQVAVPKAYKLEMLPLSGDRLQANGQNRVEQLLHVTPPTVGLKLRWKVSYNVGSTPINEDGLVENVV